MNTDPIPGGERAPQMHEEAGDLGEFLFVESASPKTSEFSGEFIDRRLERAFLRSTRSTRVRHLRVVGITASIFVVLGVVVDVLVVGNNPALIGVIVAARAVVAASIIVAIILAGRPFPAEGNLDRLIVVPILLLSAMTCAIVWVIKGELLLHAMTALVLTLVYYLFLPIRLVWAMSVSLVFAVCFIASTSIFLDIRPDEFIQVVLYLTLANILGSLVSRERNSTLRREFMVIESERRTGDNLRKEVAARTAAERAQAESETRFRSLVELSPDAILVHRDGIVLYINPVGSLLIGAADPTELIGRSLFKFILPRYRKPIADRLASFSRGAESLPPFELTIRTIDGRERPCEVVSGPILYEGRPAIQSVVRDIAERKQLREELTRLATTDPLTGISNRRSFFERLELEWSRARRHSRPLSILMFDLDHFKRINDNHGHAVGDSVLTALCAEADDLLRSEDVLARLGGEEFAVILPEIDRQTAESVAERLRQRLAAVEVVAPEGSVRCTVSIGVVQCRLAQESLDVALKRVDDALYRAKNSGRNLVCSG